MRDAMTWAAELGVSPEAVELYLTCEPFDLHLDLYVPVRLLGTNPHQRSKPRLPSAAFIGHTDFPRLVEARMAAVTLDIATNPLRRPSRRAATAHANIARVQADVAQTNGALRIVSTHAEYTAARAAGAIACFVGIQGGQAFQHDRAALESIPDVVHRITLVHLTNSGIGSTSSPLGPDRGPLSARGTELVELMNERRILVDLAHINRKGFMHAVDVHARQRHRTPLVVTHTGVSGVHPHWRNIDDQQIRAVVDTGGVVGIMFHTGFLARRARAACTAEAVVSHMEHVINVGGEGACALGTDYDGMVIPPCGLEEVTSLPRLVHAMLARGWHATRVRAVMGTNALRMIAEIRP